MATMAPFCCLQTNMFFLSNFYQSAKNIQNNKYKRYIYIYSKVFSILKTELVQKYLKALENEAQSLLLCDTHLINLIKQKQNLLKELSSLQTLDDSDKEMVKLIKEEKQQFEAQINALNEKIVRLALPDVEVNRAVVVEVTAGVGGKEAMLFAGELFAMYERYCAYKGWQWEIQEMDVPEIGGMRHGSAFVSGRDASLMLTQETGVHRVQRVPATEKAGRVHTSTVTVAVLTQPTDVEVVIKDKDIKIETKTSSGAGGQHVNKTESCVRITHLPTGIVIENQTDRSQINNRKIALQRLRSKLYQMELDGFRSKTSASRKEQVGSSMRSDKIRTYNFNQDRITDHRVGVSLHNLPSFLLGGEDLDSLINQLQSHHQEQQLLKALEDYLNTRKHIKKPT